MAVILSGISLCACTSTAHRLESDLQDGIKENIARIGPIGGLKIDYLTKEDLADPQYNGQKSQIFSNRSFGALKFSKSIGNGDDGKIFFLQKRDGAYIAETKLHETKDRSYFFSFGIDSQEKTPRIGFRLEF